MDEETGRLSSIQENSFVSNASNTSMDSQDSAPRNEFVPLNVDPSTSSDSPNDSREEVVVFHQEDENTKQQEQEAARNTMSSPFQDEYAPAPEKQHRLYIATTEEDTASQSQSASTPGSGKSSRETPTGFVVGGKHSNQYRSPTPVAGDRYIMSDASRCFDINGKGYLDSTERSLRKLDKDNDGQLTVQQMYDIMKALREEQKQSANLMEDFRKEHNKATNLKYGVVGLVVFALLLSLANIGTAFVAARLAKDTQVQDGDLVGKSSGKRLGTTDKVIEFQAKPLTQEHRRMFRRLQRRMDVQHARRLNGTEASGDDDDDNEESNEEADDYDLTCTNSFQYDPQDGTGPQTVRACASDAYIDFAGAFEIYRSFCPSFQPRARDFTLFLQPPNACPSIDGRVNSLYLVCNQRTNRLLDVNFPMGGPLEYGAANTLFPGIDDHNNVTMYTAEQVAFDPFENPPMCFQKYLLGMACLDADQGDCLLTRVLLPPYCPWYDPTRPDTRKFTVCGGADDF
mmetsp:Transcript_2307/g.4689  ORF Transcript_2307/g.4689 Transcript_2307/m.4689 type:complete len:513 (-) Transcript_2307:80-1618(-)